MLLASCKKDKDESNEGTGNTDLQVYAVDSTGTPIKNAIVNIYLSQADRDANTNSINTSLTGTEGFAYFSQLASVVYYVSVIKHYDSNNVVTKGAVDTTLPIKNKDQTAVTVVLK
jgi:hypothetical protein